MTIAQLIEKLKHLPQDEEIDIFQGDLHWDYFDLLRCEYEIELRKSTLNTLTFTRKNNEQATVCTNTPEISPDTRPRCND